MKAKHYIITEPKKLKTASELTERLKFHLHYQQSFETFKKVQTLKSARGIFRVYALAKDAKKLRC